MDHQNLHAQKRELLRIWTERLYLEYDNVLYHYRLKLQRPVLRVEPMESAWGLWSSKGRSITISQRLIEQYSWDVVIEVLKHEMAHQLVHEEFGVIELHGPHFKRACHRLGVADWAASATGQLPEKIPSWRDKLLSENEEKLLKRVEKLLALAESSNEHEASLALRKVQQLYAEHNIHRIMGRHESPSVYCLITEKKKRIESSESLLFSILNEHFFVKTIFTTTFDAHDLEEYKAVEILGSRENVLMAEYVYYFLRRQVEALWQGYRRSQGASGQAAKKSYVLGVLSGFRERLKKDNAHVFSGATADVNGGDPNNHDIYSLIKADEKQLATYLCYRHPKISSRRFGTAYGDNRSFQAGVADGGKIKVHRGLGSSPFSGPRLLPS